MVYIGSIVLNKTETALEVGKTLALTATVLPDIATDKTLKWKSSDDTVASVNASRIVTAHKTGKATVTALAQDGSGKMASCRITVTKASDGNVQQGSAEQPGNTQKPSVLSKGTVFTDDSTKAAYKVTKKGKTINGSVAGAEAEYTKPTGTSASVTIPATVTCNGVKYKVTSIASGAFKGSKSLTKVKIGSNARTVGASAFSGCKKLKTVTVGKNVMAIQDKAFYKCTALTEITIPSRVNKIGKQAFYGCRKLKTVKIKTAKLTKKNVGSQAFKGLYSKATIKVPKKKLSAYKKFLKSKGVPAKAKIK